MLNLRMGNDPDSEVLAHLAAATELKLLGLDGTQEWIFVEYAGEPGQIIRCWVSADYAQLQAEQAPRERRHLAGAGRDGRARIRQPHAGRHSRRRRRGSHRRYPRRLRPWSASMAKSTLTPAPCCICAAILAPTPSRSP